MPSPDFKAMQTNLKNNVSIHGNYFLSNSINVKSGVELPTLNSFVQQR